LTHGFLALKVFLVPSFSYDDAQALACLAVLVFRLRSSLPRIRPASAPNLGHVSAVTTQYTTTLFACLPRLFRGKFVPLAATVSRLTAEALNRPCSLRVHGGEPAFAFAVHFH
jgi:hypothetical protein